MTRSLSLRTRAAVASGIGATVVVVLVAVLALVLLARDQALRLDSGDGLAVTLRGVDGERVLSGPALPATDGPVRLDGVLYRVRTAPAAAPGTVVSIGVPDRADRAAAVRRRRLVLLVAVAAVLLAAGVGWLLAGRAVRPLRVVTDRARTLGPDSPPTTIRGDGARESEELADALTGLVGRVRAEQERSRRALVDARDFAAAARHELRTPLTAMRTDLEVLRDHPDLPDAAAVVADLLRSQERVEATLTALGQLAGGELADPEGRRSVAVTDLLRVAVEDARRVHPGLAVEVGPHPDTVFDAWPDGLRLALSTLVENAARHGRASRVVLGARVERPGVVLVVDDDGPGVPAAEREAVLGRFVRGSTASGPGSGLGLALVAQQAARHGGIVRLLDAPHGGLRVELGLPVERT